MPTVAYTNNTTNTNGGVVDRIVSGCQSTYVDESTPSTRYGNSVDIDAGVFIDEFKNVLLRAPGMRYDLPTAAVVSSATLYVKTGIGFSSFDMTSHKLLRDWWKDHCSWDSPNLLDSWTTTGGTGAGDIGPSTDTQTVSAQGVWVAFDVTSIIQDVADDRDTDGVLLQSVRTGGDSFRRFIKDTGADGDRWELIVTYTGGTDAPVYPTDQAPPITFTGDNGDPLPSGLTAYRGTFEIRDNELACTDLGVGGNGGNVGADTGTYDGVYTVTYSPAGSTAANGAMIRSHDNLHFVDLVDIGGTGDFQLIPVVNGVAAAQLASYTIPGYSQNGRYEMVFRMDWDRIRIDIDGVVDAIDVETSYFHKSTICGGKFGSISGPRLDDMTFPTLPSSGGVINGGFPFGLMDYFI